MVLQNPIGFGTSDFIELGLAILLAAMALVSLPWAEPFARKLAVKMGWCMLLLALLPVALRLALLPTHPVPSPNVYDEFGHLLVADTLLHFRLANPPHALPQFFETFFVLQTPAYASIYPIGQGLMLGIGRAVFGLPWAGVLLSTAALCSLCYWMLLGWTTRAWALVGGMLAVIEFGPLSSWMNSYWGGSFAAVAGCLVFGALPRLRATARIRDGVLLGLGVAMHWLTRPYETVFLCFGVLLFFLPDMRYPAELRRFVRPAFAAAIALLPTVGLSLLQNKHITGKWTTLPYALSRYQYGVPASFTWQANAEPHRELTREQQLQYKMQLSYRPSGRDTIQTYLQRLAYRVHFYRFFFLAPLYVALPFFFLRLREFRFFWVALTLLLFALGINFYAFFEVHYLGALTCLFVLVSVVGLQQLPNNVARIILFLCIAHFLFWYGRSFFDRPVPDGRVAVNRQLGDTPGKKLVFVRYWPQHRFQDEWVYNAADIDRARVVWARDLGPSEDRKLLGYYPDRSLWLLEPDATPPKLSRYQSAEEQPKPVPAPVKAQPQPPLRFEPVR
ncbi:MAG: hypothetical protein JOZ32_02235 [Bryobacterales bacterium]|nr:hypothetical protein [Bryobacterales bacterium]